jgi:cell division protein FtsQ
MPLSARSIPTTIEVRIEEREAFAIWQHGNQSLIEKDGKIIAPYAGGRQATLPLVVGFGAADRAADFVARVQAFPALGSRVKGYIRVGERRWDLRLDNGITVKLPENQVDAALADLLPISTARTRC